MRKWAIEVRKVVFPFPESPVSPENQENPEHPEHPERKACKEQPLPTKVNTA